MTIVAEWFLWKITVLKKQIVSFCFGRRRIVFMHGVREVRELDRSVNSCSSDHELQSFTKTVLCLGSGSLGI